jgi:hypothetical protein
MNFIFLKKSDVHFMFFSAIVPNYCIQQAFWVAVSLSFHPAQSRVPLKEFCGEGGTGGRWAPF